MWAAAIVLCTQLPLTAQVLGEALAGIVKSISVCVGGGCGCIIVVYEL